MTTSQLSINHKTIKIMKKLIFVITLMMIGVFAMAQTGLTPVDQNRVATRTTPFGYDVPVGTTIYCVADSTWNTAKVGVAGPTATLTSAASSFKVEYRNPMTASGDIIYGGTSGTATRLAKGDDGQILQLASGVPSWVTPAAGHSAVTIGTANGLSLNTQELSLGTASTSTTGALTDTDWDLFNGKEGGFTRAHVTVTVANADSTSSYHITLAGAPITGSVTVLYNGSALEETTQYNIESSKIHVNGGAYQFDKFYVSYNYRP